MDGVIFGTFPALACNQVELHPLIDQRILEACSISLKIPLQAYCPPGRGRALGNPVIVQIAKAHAVSEAAIIFRWLLQRGITPVTMTTKRYNALGNLAALAVELTPDDMAAISDLRLANCRLISIPELERAWD